MTVTDETLKEVEAAMEAVIDEYESQTYGPKMYNMGRLCVALAKLRKEMEQADAGN